MLLIRLSLTRTAGPVAIGSDITYGWILTNDGARAASAQTLTVDAGTGNGRLYHRPDSGANRPKERPDLPGRHDLYDDGNNDRAAVGHMVRHRTWRSHYPYPHRLQHRYFTCRRRINYKHCHAGDGQVGNFHRPPNQGAGRCFLQEQLADPGLDYGSIT